MRTLDQLQALHKETKEKMFQESIAKTRIIDSGEYQFLAEQLQSIAKKQVDMLKDCPDSSSILQEIEAEMLEIFRDQKLSQYKDFKGKFRNKNKVNNGRLIGTIDLDTFITLAEVSQVKLKDFAEPYKGESLHKEILDCIETVGRELVGVERIYTE